MKIIFWFRQDLRLKDNPAFANATEKGTVLAIYILDEANAGIYKMGSASRWWLHHSLDSLSKDLSGKLAFFRGDPLEILSRLIKSEGINAVYWNRCYELWQIQRDRKIKATLQKMGTNVYSENGLLLWEPWKIVNQQKTYYRVFTPYYKKGCLCHQIPRKPISKPKDIRLFQSIKGRSLQSLDLLPSQNWTSKFTKYWKVGEKAAEKQLNLFLKEGIIGYQKGRDFPSKQFVSRLSPYLHFGEISPHTVWHTFNKRSSDIDQYKMELGWREFSYYLLYHFPELPKKNFQKKFDKFQWKKDLDKQKKWQKGLTGVPFVDAAMRELWETGYMHNRMRMVAASFFIKNLLQPWQDGEDWFWDCLVDADLASNSANWQWVAGSGADAAPYFRIFNPVTQAEKFDPDGTYIHRYVPELRHLSPPYLFSPWEAPQNILEKANVKIGTSYPIPIVQLQKSRKQALAAFKFL